jgi:hypothetical protein
MGTPDWLDEYGSRGKIRPASEINWPALAGRRGLPPFGPRNLPLSDFATVAAAQ